ncbi:hypothetical protein BB561_002155 [Smittium simulii]|uniref:Uncharacterized protein n=1 Tax=Smittium simulii TaxID=133385 RepID=A0A2T9YRT4_9FUNG|nr:hypothetical protein BB561_002155 [Smittium simulii]
MAEGKGWLDEAARLALAGATLGLVASTTQNAFSKTTVGFSPIFTKYGSNIGYFAVMGGVYAGVRNITSQIREKDDFINGSIAGCAVGFIAGVKKRSLASGVGACLFLGTSVGVIDYTSRIENKLSELTPAERERVRKEFYSFSEEDKKSDSS